MSHYKTALTQPQDNHIRLTVFGFLTAPLLFLVTAGTMIAL